MGEHGVGPERLGRGRWYLEIFAMSRGESLIQIYCEITGMSESFARCAMIMNDALHRDVGSSNMGWTVPVSRVRTSAPVLAPQSAIASVRTETRDERKDFDHVIEPVLAARLVGQPRKRRSVAPAGIPNSNYPSHEPSPLPSAP